MRMILRLWLVPVDLPVDVVVVLEQQERAGQAQGVERALRELGGCLVGEHLFVEGRQALGRSRHERVYVSGVDSRTRIAEPISGY